MDTACEFIERASENSRFFSTLLTQIEHMLDPGCRLYVQSLESIPNDKLPLYYLFPGARIRYKDEEYVTVSVSRKSICLRRSGADNADSFSVELNSRHLSVPRDLFHSNYSAWVNALQVGEVVDIAITKPSSSIWHRGLIRSITRDGHRVKSLEVVYYDSYAPDLAPPEEHTVHIDEFNENTLNREFLRCRTPCEGLLPFRYAFPQNKLIPSVNTSIEPHVGLAAAACGLSIVSPLYMMMVNAVTMNNIWYALAQCVDEVVVWPRRDA